MSDALTLYELRDALRRHDEDAGRPVRRGFTIADMLEAQDLDKPKLLCEQCRCRKLREEFRETPWHGRAARCKSCEGFRYLDEIRERMAWELEQEREKCRAWRRAAGRLKSRLRVVSAIAGALEDSLPGDNWFSAHAIKQLASGEIDGETAMKEAFPYDG